MRGALAAALLCLSCGRVGFQAVAADAARDASSDAAGDARPLSTIAALQTGANTSVAASNVLMLPLDVEDHDAIIACFTFASASATLQSIGDSLGNSYSIVAGPVVSNGYVHYVAVAASSPAGSDALTVTLSTADSGGWDLLAVEYAGLSATAPFDATADDFGNGSAMASGSVTTSAPHELLLGYGHSTGMMPGSGYTARVQTTESLIEDQIVFTAGSYTATGSTMPGIWTLILATFADR